MRACGYVRYWKRESDEELSLSDQMKKIRAYSENRQLELVEMVEEEDAAKEELRERSGMKRVRELVEQDRVDVVVVARFDRLGRSVVEAKWLTDLLTKSGKGFVAVEEQIDTMRDFGTFQTLVRMCEWEREWVQKQQLDRRKEKVRSGRKPSSFNLGYKRDKKGDYIIDEEQAQTVRAMFRLYLEHRTVQRVADALNNDLKVKTRRGGKWSTKSVHSILTNPVYVAKIKWQGEIVDGTHEALVDAATFERVNDLLATSARGGKRGRPDSSNMK
jgi:site-specific DNA recombinase